MRDTKLRVFDSVIFPYILRNDATGITVKLLSIENNNSATYGYPRGEGSWNMKIVLKNGEFISKIHHKKYLHNKKWVKDNKNGNRELLETKIDFIQSNILELVKDDFEAMRHETPKEINSIEEYANKYGFFVAGNYDKKYQRTRQQIALAIYTNEIAVHRNLKQIKFKDITEIEVEILLTEISKEMEG